MVAAIKWVIVKCTRRLTHTLYPLSLFLLSVVKTKVQTDPIKYPGVIRSFNTVWKEEGPTGFLQGWAPTFLGFFLLGGASYTLTEFIRRTLTKSLGPEVAAGAYEVPIILCAAAVGAFLGSFILCPFESVRIRSVSQTDYAPNIVQVCLRMVREEGLSSLFAAVPVFLVKEIPFAMAKFTVFDLSTAYMYNQFPAAKEDLGLSLLVSLLGGTLGGMSAAVVSNPADVTISTLKKQKSSQGALATAQTIWQDGGPSAFFRGLPLRFIFYALLVSLQFLVYDSIRFALGIGTDDLKLYLDVLGGALSERAS
jgi:solute carrier family 25 (mitochondrial phosphate transporter), member 3